MKLLRYYISFFLLKFTAPPHAGSGTWLLSSRSRISNHDNESVGLLAFATNCETMQNHKTSQDQILYEVLCENNYMSRSLQDES